MISEATIIKNLRTKNLFPEDFHYSIDGFKKPFNIPLKIEKITPRIVTKRVPDYSDNNDNGFDNDNDILSPIDDNRPLNNINEAEKEEEPKELLIDLTNKDPIKLIEPPKNIQKLQIDYAKTATKVDLKDLKDTIWKEISLKKDKNTLTEVVKNTQQKTINNNNNNNNNVSIPFYFICLLHLANEHNLEITGNNELSDLMV